MPDICVLLRPARARCLRPMAHTSTGPMAARYVMVLLHSAMSALLRPAHARARYTANGAYSVCTLLCLRMHARVPRPMARASAGPMAASRIVFRSPAGASACCRARAGRFVRACALLGLPIHVGASRFPRATLALSRSIMSRTSSCLLSCCSTSGAPVGRLLQWMRSAHSVAVSCRHCQRTRVTPHAHGMRARHAPHTSVSSPGLNRVTSSAMLFLCSLLGRVLLDLRSFLLSRHCALRYTSRYTSLP
jgi:hypothetical protein